MLSGSDGGQRLISTRGEKDRGCCDIWSAASSLRRFRRNFRTNQYEEQVEGRTDDRLRGGENLGSDASGNRAI